MSILQRQQIMSNYTVLFVIKQSFYADTYIVKSMTGKLYFMKLINYAKLSKSQYTVDGYVQEIEILRKINHPNICSYVDSGNLILNGQKFAYLITDFISGETVAQKIIRGQKYNVYDTKQIAIHVLEALQYLHSLTVPVIHNDLTIQNVMLDLANNENNRIRLIDFGHARFLDQENVVLSLDDVNPFYFAPEYFNGVCCVQSDLYSVGVMIYHLLYGMLPWYVDLPLSDINACINLLLEARRKPLRLPDLNLFELDEQLINIMVKAMAQNVDDRFQSASEFIQALHGQIIVKVKQPVGLSVKDGKTKSDNIDNKKRGNGFADVAGMQQLKETLCRTVINVLHDKERAKQYGVRIPNGMSLYGPPGCGKTFIAECFAEEAGYNYIYVKSSDLASIYVHGSQEKIGKLFDEARKNAPTILCFDEFDSLVPSRDRVNSASQAGEVNEFLSQLNNCGADNVFVIASTNKPDLIDPAVLRKGRIDKLIYIPLPDKAARKTMLELAIKKRPYDFGIDYDLLADMTEGYVSSEIAFIVNEASGVAFINNEKITQFHLENVIKENKPSLTKEAIAYYEKLRDKMEGYSIYSTDRNKIGFK